MVNVFEKAKSPCMGCKARSINCHASCDKYRQWKLSCYKKADEYYGKKIHTNA